MSDYDRSIHYNPSALAWAEFFCLHYPEMDVDLMTSWFANAMMAMSDWEAREREKQQPLAEKEIVRRWPDTWKVGQKVRYITRNEWAWDKGQLGVVISLKDEFRGQPAGKYQHFYTRPIGYTGGFYWTTPDDVELVEDV